MATWADLLNYRQYIVRSDGAKFIDGVRNDNLNTSWLTLSPTVSLGPGLYDELMVITRVADEDEIKAWAQAGAPWYDPSPVIPDTQIESADYWNGPIDANERPISARGSGGYIEFDKYGQRFIRNSDGKTMIKFDTETGDATFGGKLEADEVMAGIVAAGGITADYIKSINADLATITAANGKVVIGDISGKQWQGSPLPAGTFGLWAPDGFIATTQTHVLQVAEATGYQTTSTSYVDLANFTATFALKRKATVIINVTMQGGVGLDSAYGHAAYRLTINGNPIPETVVWGSADSSGAFRDKWFPVATHTMQSLPAGTHSVGVQFARGTSAHRAIIANRVMTILVLYG